MIQLAQHSIVLLATREEMHRVWGRFDHQRPGISTNQLALFIAALAIVIIAVVILRVVRSRAARTFSADSSAKLFRELCAAHGIKRSSRRLLKQLAAARDVTDPATLFVEPRYFELQSMPRELKASTRELRILEETLFG